MKKAIPVYDICAIDSSFDKDLLAERLENYLEKHYQHLSSPHRHSFYHLVLFTKGSGSHSIDFNRYHVNPYQVYFMAPGQVHSWQFEGRTEGYIVHFNTELFSRFLQQRDRIEQFPFFSGTTDNAVLTLPAQIREKAVALLESVIEEINENRHSHDLIRLLLLEFFIYIERHCVKEPLTDVPQQKLVMLRHFKLLIEKHFRLLRLPKEYAELMYITPNHLNALCQDLLGKTSGQLIRERIILEAKRLLVNAEMDISEIAYDLNFQDNSYFSRFFKKNTGITPEEFRKQIQEKKIS